jgi:hypothetical protein
MSEIKKTKRSSKIWFLISLVISSAFLWYELTNNLALDSNIGLSFIIFGLFAAVVIIKAITGEGVRVESFKIKAGRVVLPLGKLHVFDDRGLVLDQHNIVSVELDEDFNQSIFNRASVNVIVLKDAKQKLINVGPFKRSVAEDLLQIILDIKNDNVIRTEFVNYSNATTSNYGTVKDGDQFKTTPKRLFGIVFGLLFGFALVLGLMVLGFEYFYESHLERMMN